MSRIVQAIRDFFINLFFCFGTQYEQGLNPRPPGIEYIYVLNEHAAQVNQHFDIDEVVYDGYDGAGHGGFGDVYECIKRQPDDGALVTRCALKVMSTDYVCTTRKQRRMWRSQVDNEISNLRALQHPNIVEMYDYLFLDNHKHVVIKMEKLDITLLELLEGNNVGNDENIRMSFTASLRLAKQVGSVIEFMHSQGWSHHDLKITNVMLKCNPVPDTDPLLSVIYKLIDLGYAKRYTKPVERHINAGTFYYAAPEKVLLIRGYDPFLSDAFAFGVILLQAILGWRVLDELKKQYVNFAEACNFGVQELGPEWSVDGSPENVFLKAVQELVNNAPGRRITVAEFLEKIRHLE